MNLSGIVIAKNEEEVISKALKSLSFCDEVIVIDNDSSDKTADLAKELGAKVFKKSTDNFSELRNYGRENAQGKFLLYIDSDEVVSLELAENIMKAIASDKIAAYRIKRKNFYLGKNEWPYIEKMKRLFLKEKLMGWRGSIHESPISDGSVGDLDGFLLHFTHRNLGQMLNKTISWSDEEARIRLLAKHPKITWWRFPRVMITSFFSYYIKQKGFKLGTSGLIESIYQAFSTFITYAKLWEMQNKSTK